MVLSAVFHFARDLRSFDKTIVSGNVSGNVFKRLGKAVYGEIIKDHI